MRVPSYRLHKPSGQAVVTLAGQDHYLGRHGTPESRRRYDRLIAEWMAAGRRLPTRPRQGLTVLELAAAYLPAAEQHYRSPAGLPTKRWPMTVAAVGVVVDLYGETPAADFGPLAYQAVRQVWIDRGMARRSVNDYAQQVCQMFRWGVAHELVPPSVWQGLRSVPRLQAGRSAARETAPVGPVDLERVEAVRAFVAPQVWALIQLQLLTGARQGELCGMRPCDLDMSGDVWTLRVASHKTARSKGAKLILLGPRAQAILQPFMDRPQGVPCFSPREGNAAQRIAKKGHPRRPGQKRQAPRTTRRLGDAYTPGSYALAIRRACRRAGIEPWHPHQLRHAAASRIRAEAGLDAARGLLGHAGAGSVTEVYAEADRQALAELVRRMG